LTALVGHRFRDVVPVVERIEAIYASPETDALDTLELVDGHVFERFSRPQMLDGKMVGRVWSYSDVTDRRRAEEAAREEARVLDLLNRTGAAISSTLELDALLQKVTDAARELSDAEFGAFFYTPPTNRATSISSTPCRGLPAKRLNRSANRVPRRCSAPPSTARHRCAVMT
jgi:hypothetical protein